MSWEEDVARRRWAYFLARRREFENVGTASEHMHDAQTACPCTHGTQQTHPPPSGHPVETHVRRNDASFATQLRATVNGDATGVMSGRQYLDETTASTRQLLRLMRV